MHVYSFAGIHHLMSEIYKFNFTANLLLLLSVTVTKKGKSYRGCLNLLTHSNP